MSEKLEKIAADLKRACAKRDQWDRRVKELERKYRDTENTEIHELVHLAGLTPEQLAALLKTLPGTAPGGSPLDAVGLLKEDTDTALDVAGLSVDAARAATGTAGQFQDPAQCLDGTRYAGDVDYSAYHFIETEENKEEDPIYEN